MKKIMRTVSVSAGVYGCAAWIMTERGRKII
jgi:hypothetical protein